MIRAELERAGEMCLLSAEGRAAGMPGTGAAAIVYALAGWLKRHRPEELAVRLEPGEAWLWCRRDPAVDAAFGVAAEGLLRLAKEYPKDIRMEVDR